MRAAAQSQVPDVAALCDCSDATQGDVAAVGEVNSADKRPLLGSDLAEDGVGGPINIKKEEVCVG